MQKKQIKINLFDGVSINDAIKQIQEYNRNLKRKTQILIDKLAEKGLEVVQTTMESVPAEEKGSYNTEIINNSRGDIIGAAIRLTGDKVLFIEFSAGITYGTPKGGYPLDSGKQYGVGTYPGQVHALDPRGWWWVDEQGNKHHSYGNRAYMPMYHAEVEILSQVSNIAKEVFGR